MWQKLQEYHACRPPAVRSAVQVARPLQHGRVSARGVLAQQLRVAPLQALQCHPLKVVLRARRNARPVVSRSNS